MNGAPGGTRDEGAAAKRASVGDFAERYRAAFLVYLASGDDADVTPAYELSRDAVGGRLSLLELAEAHREAVAAAVVPEPDPARRALLAARAADFLRESLATFEIAHRGYLEVQEVARLEHEHARQLQTVAEVSVALNAALPVADVIELVTAEARNVLGGRSARAHLELPGMQPRRTITATSGEPPPEGERTAGALRASLTGRRGLVVGELEVFGVDEDDPGDEAILVQLAQVASAAIGNAQLYGLEREIAETLQASLLPQRLPRIEGLDVEARYSPAGDGMVVGGDFYDVFRTNGTAWGLAIGDVCGKGPHAAALTALVRYTLRAAALWERRPERVMAMLNEAILDQRSDHRFCTALYGQLHLLEEGGARVDFVTAGHPLPLVRRAGGKVEPVGSWSTVLGVVPDPELHADSVVLAPGDLLLLYTDGVTEVRRRGREVFGVEQLQALLGEIGELSAAKTVERIEDAVLNASGGPPRDDIAVIAVRIPA